ncbi:hypothetical protein HOLleu_41686 [Holothuria leucospilota]|uniref:Innexin n=1 Tax=Holothuria leucospilota TaxID=206669 RepID=A0A9Q0YC25_HOLLE|nr:hypothetical protein HOLleu_41686 [Holothuria leucospilota]
MADAAKLLKDLLPAVNNVFGQEILKSGSINTNLPSDNLGFWLTQGVPFGLFFAHILMAVIGERDVGRCFVPGIKDNQLAPSQIQYITELCVDQAAHYECFDDDKGTLIDVCKSSYLCDEDITNSTNSYFGDDSEKPSIFETLFFYRYYIWFLCFFTFIRALPQIVWKLYCTADIRKAVQDIAILAEFQHAMCGVTALVSGDKTDTTNNGRQEERPAWMKYMDTIVIREVQRRATGKSLFAAYLIRKLADVFLDCLIFILLLWFYFHRTPFDHLVFVCDLHRDRDNIFLCETLKRQFIPCTVSFGFEFVITGFILFFVMIFDFIVQVWCILKFTRIGHRFVRFISGEYLLDTIQFWEPFISRELELDQNDQWEDFDKSFMYSPNDLYLVGLLYKQSNVSHAHFLKMMSEKMLEQLRPAFAYMRQKSVHELSDHPEASGNESHESVESSLTRSGFYFPDPSNSSGVSLRSIPFSRPT